jgi:3-polyprenyl-4-hydroxybenzoate decarboxylase
MQEVELASLLQEAGYVFDPSTGRYQTADAVDGDVDYATEDIADQLQIPIDDLMRWEQEQSRPPGR